jgi:hypothetical protein
MIQCRLSGLILLFATVVGHAQQSAENRDAAADPAEVQFSATTDRHAYRMDDLMTLRLRVKNVGRHFLYVQHRLADACGFGLNITFVDTKGKEHPGSMDCECSCLGFEANATLATFAHEYSVRLEPGGVYGRDFELRVAAQSLTPGDYRVVFKFRTIGPTSFRPDVNAADKLKGSVLMGDYDINPSSVKIVK